MTTYTVLLYTNCCKKVHDCMKLFPYSIKKFFSVLPACVCRLFLPPHSLGVSIVCSICMPLKYLGFLTLIWKCGRNSEGDLLQKLCKYSNKSVSFLGKYTLGIMHSVLLKDNGWNVKKYSFLWHSKRLQRMSLVVLKCSRVVIWEHSLKKGHILALQHVWDKNEAPRL